MKLTGVLNFIQPHHGNWFLILHDRVDLNKDDQTDRHKQISPDYQAFLSDFQSLISR